MEKNNFDFLRFILAFTVIVGHTIELSGRHDLYLIKPYFNTSLAVKGFFVISGYLITMSYISTNNWKKYFIKRARRLLPAYLAVIFLCIIVLSVISEFSVSAYFTHRDLFKYVIANVTFMNFIHPCLPGVFNENVMCAVNGALWTLKIEVMFYFAVPFLIILIQKFHKKYLLFLCIYILSLIYKYYMEFNFYKTGDDLYSSLSHQLPAFMTYFISGISLYYYRNIFTKNQFLLFVISVIVYLIENYYKVEYLKPIALACILFYLAYNFKFLNNFGSRGDISYGIYIFHFPIIQMAYHFTFFTKYNNWLMLLAIIMATLIMGILSWNLIEKRFLLRRYINK